MIGDLMDFGIQCRTSPRALALVVSLSVALSAVPASVRAQDTDLNAALERISTLEQQVQRLTQLPAESRTGLPGKLSTDASAISPASFEQVTPCRCGAVCDPDQKACSSSCQAGCCSAEPKEKTEQLLKAVYDGGFVLRPVDADKTPFELKINSWLQLRHSVFDSDGTNPDQNDFEFERVRLTFGGYALTRDLEYYFQLDGDDNQAQRLDLLDYYLSYDVGHDQLGMESGKLGFRTGRWKVPFNRSRYTSGLNLQFADRSLAGVFFDIDRSVGMSLYGEADAPVAPINWEFALINGIRTNNARPNRVGDLDRNLGVSGRIFQDVVGKWGSDYESDIAWHEDLAVRLGAGFAYSREDIPEGAVEASRQRVVDSGATLTSLLPASASGYSVSMFAISADFRCQGWSLSTEYYFRNLSDISGTTIPNLFDHGFLLQSGYFLVPKKFEVFSRWSRIVGDSGSLGTGKQSADEVAGGLAWWIKGRNLKLLFDVTRVNSSPVNDSAVGLQPGDDGLLYRTQLQFLF